MIAQRCTMNDGPMPNCTLFTNGQGRIGIDMQGAIILDVGARTNNNGSAVATYNGVIPDACTLMNGDIANNHCTRGNEDVICDGRPNAVIRENRHDFLLTVKHCSSQTPGLPGVPPCGASGRDTTA